MAHEPAAGSLPVFYGERMPDESLVQRPIHQSASRDALLRLPIQSPHAAHVDPSLGSPSSPVIPNSGGLGLASMNTGTPSRTATQRMSKDRGRYLTYPDQGEDQPYRGGRRYEPYQPDYRGPYIEDDYDDEDHYRAYRRPSRRYSSKPPLSHQNFHSRHTARFTGDGPRGSGESGRVSFDESDTPTKPRIYYDYGSDEGESRQHYRPRAGGDGGRGPPRRSPSKEEVLRLPWSMWMNSNAKNQFVAFVGEFIGTTMFLFFAFAGTQVANIGSSDSSANTTTGASTGFSPQVLQYIALVFAFSLMVNVWIFFRISGGLFNPAVTFAMLLTKAMTPFRFALLLVAQLAGGIFASFLVSVLFPTPLNVRTTLSSDTSLVRGVFIEAVLTAELVFTIFMLAKEKHKATFIAPVGIGLALFIAELVGVYYTGGSLNPARSFGPCVITGHFDQEHWIYWVGPGIGAIIAVAFYRFIKILEYEVANPGQDDDEKEAKEKE